MAHAKNHDYHILPPSIYPFIGGVGAFVMLFGAVLWMHGSGPWMFAIGAVAIAYVMFGWWVRRRGREPRRATTRRSCGSGCATGSSSSSCRR